eukprot:1747787-Rhodomonas_salina.1
MSDRVKLKIPKILQNKMEKFNNSIQNVSDHFALAVKVQIVAAVLHAAAAVTLMTLILTEFATEVWIPLTGTFPVWGEPLNSAFTAEFSDMLIQQKTERAFSVKGIPVGWSCVMFFGLSFLFETVGVIEMFQIKQKLVPTKTDEATPGVNNRPFLRVYALRFAEYSISASVMLVVISNQVGIWDWRILYGIATLSMTCMLCGVSAEMAIDAKPPQTKTATAAFVAGSVAVLNAWVPIVWTFARGFTSKTPLFVIGIVASEFVLWMIFAVVQLMQIVNGWPPDKVMPAYSILSLVSKLTLGGIVSAFVLV